MEITFLGTSSMVPTKDRNQIGVLLSYGSEGILFDCGEGIQRQIKLAGEKITKVTKILISHWHGDHVLGLPGLIQTLSASTFDGTLEIYGPGGTKNRMKKMFETFIFDNQIDIKIKEVKEGLIFENDDFLIKAEKMEHGIPTLGYRFEEKDKRKINISKLKKFKVPQGPLVGKLQSGKSITIDGKKIKPDDVGRIEKGRSIAFVTDTVINKNCSKLAKDVDLLICESTYASKLEEKAEKHNHMTAKDASLLASNSGAKKLALIHFSARYKEIDEIEEEAKTYFDNTVCAYDLMKMRI
tara:strand:- start:330 stop:1220 length:891 start_codon:yes stop_codon:yes gene_type:complete